MSTELAPNEFTILLRGFNALIDGRPEASTIKEKLLKIKAAGQASGELNYRQRDAISARVDNYLNGSYGVDPIKEAYLKQPTK